MTTLLPALLLAAGNALAVPQPAAHATPPAGRVVRGHRPVVGVVTSADAAARTLTIKTANGGETLTVTVPAAAPVNRTLELADVRKGELVTAVFTSAGGKAEIRNALFGEAGPAGAPRAPASPRRFVGTVDAVDAGARTLALRSADGETRTFHVADHAHLMRVGGVENVSAGDAVTIVYDARSEAPVVRLVILHPPKPR